MPNWCVTQYVIKGDKAEIKDFCEVLNNLPEYREEGNRFGKYWLGNLFAYYEEKELKDEGTAEEIHERVNNWLKGRTSFMRGELSPDFCAVPTLGGISEYDEWETFQPYAFDKDRVEFSTCTAWDRSEDFERLLQKHYPSFTFAWCNTDEWGNFHLYHDEEGIGRDALTRYMLNDYQYTKPEFDAFREAVREALDGIIEVPTDADEQFFRSGAFMEKAFDAIADKNNYERFYKFVVYQDA